MSSNQIKPLEWTTDPHIGFNVVRRPDGGMHFTFFYLDDATLEQWRNFALKHLYESDRLTRNLYDLSRLEEIPEKAVQYAVEVNNDPSVRNIRLAVVATHEKVRQAMRKIADLSVPGGVELGLFRSLEEAEAWLSRPLTMVV